MNHSRAEKMEAFGRLLDVMDELREKCPWDKKQTMESLRNLTIEETYELVDAIIEKDLPGVKEELGDLLLHVVFYAKIGSEKEAFDIKDVIDHNCEKLIQRHPHIYGDVEVKDEQEVKQNWEKLKLKEGKKSVLSGVPSALPALIKAYRIQDKAGQIGFQWDDIRDVWAKVAEEVAELQQAESQVGFKRREENMEEEFGDVLFALVNYARYVGIDPETALEKTNKKFIRRFQFIEDTAKREKLDLEEMTLEQMDVFWEQAKSEEKKANSN